MTKVLEYLERNERNMHLLMNMMQSATNNGPAVCAELPEGLTIPLETREELSRAEEILIDPGCQRSMVGLCLHF